MLLTNALIHRRNHNQTIDAGIPLHDLFLSQVPSKQIHRKQENVQHLFLRKLTLIQWLAES